MRACINEKMTKGNGRSALYSRVVPSSVSALEVCILIEHLMLGGSMKISRTDKTTSTANSTKASAMPTFLTHVSFQHSKLETPITRRRLSRISKMLWTGAMVMSLVCKRGRDGHNLGWSTRPCSTYKP